jgi:glycosyltransferase involved in cell wall biosynthesis
MVSQHRYHPRQIDLQFPGHPTLSRNLSELLAHGVQIDLVCITPQLCFGCRVPEHPGIRLYGIPLKPRRDPAYWYLLQYAIFFLWALVAASGLGLRRRYDIVQVDTLPDLLVFSALVPRLRGVPVVLYVYDLMPEMTAVRLGIDGDDRRVKLVAAIERAATTWADRVITVTDRFRRIMAGRGLDSRKVVLVANSHPVNELPPRVPPRSPVLILPTTLIERYGVQVAIYAVDKLRRDWPDLTLRIIGDGENRADLMALAQRLGLSDHVSFSRGFVPWREAMEEVRRASIGIVPITAEGYGNLILPNKVFEFVFLEIPLVCSRLPGIQDHLPPDAVAYFEPGDAGGLAAQVHRLLTNPEVARQQAARAKVVMADLAWEHASRRYLEALGVMPRFASALARSDGGSVGNNRRVSLHTSEEPRQADGRVGERRKRVPPVEYRRHRGSDH